MYRTTIWNNEIKIETNLELFSPEYVDRGTMAMLNNIDLKEDEKVLDLGCGTGIVGIAAAKVLGEEKVIMADVDPIAIEISKSNAILNGAGEIKILKSDGFKNIDDFDFTLILSNPPYHTDFSVAKHFIEEGNKHLILGGKMVLVVKRLKWYKNKMTSIFGGVKVIEEDGYYILISEKREKLDKGKKDKPIKKKHMKKLMKNKRR